MTYSQEVLADAPLVYYDCQEISGTSAADSSGHGNNGAYVNGAVVADTTDPAAPPALGRHVRLDGSNDYIDLASAGNWLDVTNGITMEGWFFVRSVASWQRFFVFANVLEANTDDIALGRNGTTGGFFVNVNAAGNWNTGTVPSLNAWHHIVLTISPTGAANLYVDGALMSTGSVTIPSVTARQYKWVGRSQYAADAYNPASVTQIAVYGTPLTADRVKAHFNAGVGGSYAALVRADGSIGQWPLDDVVSSGPIIDVSAQLSTGTYESGAASADAVVPSDKDGKSLAAAAGGAVVTPKGTLASYTGTTFTAEAWVKFDNVTAGTTNAAWSYILEQAFGTTQSRIYLWWGSLGGLTGLTFGWSPSNNTFNDHRVAWQPVAGTVYHIVATADGTNVNFYVNGALLGSVAQKAGAIPAGSTANVYIGRRGVGTGGNFQGKIDDLSLFSTALSAGKVQEHYASGISKYASEVLNDAPLAYWRLGEASGTAAIDSSGSARPGTYGSGATLAQPSLLNTDTVDKSIAVAASGVVPVDVPSATWMNVAQFSAEAWFKVTALTGTQTIVSRYNGSTGTGMMFSLRLDGGNLIFYRGAGSGFLSTPGVAVQANTVYHVVATYDGTTARVYLNGKLVASAAQGAHNQPAQNIDIGGNQAGGERLIGTIDEAAFYGSALSAARIAAHYGAGSPQAISQGIGLVTSATTVLPITDGSIKQQIGQVIASITARGMSLKLGIGRPAVSTVAQKMTAVFSPESFVAAQAINDYVGNLIIDMSTFGLDAGEPNPYGATRTSWLSWYAPDDLGPGDLERFHTRGSSVPTSIAIFTGNALGNLVQVAGSATGDLKFSPTAGTTYYIQLGTKTDPANAVSITWLDGMPQDWDVFATPLVLDDDFGSDELTNTNNTTESGEPIPTGTKATSWMSWYSNTGEDVVINVNNINAAAFTLRAYSGTSLGTLVQVASSSGTDTASIQFTPVAGQTYMIQVSTADDLDDGMEVSWYIVAAPNDPEAVPTPYPLPAGQLEVPLVALRAEVYEPDGKTLITEVPRRKGVKWQEQLNVVGSGSMQVLLSDEILDAYPDLFDWNNIVKFWIGSKCVHGFVIKKRSTKVVDSGEVVALVKEVSGPSVQYLMNDFIVRHPVTPRPDSSDKRYFGWAAPKGEWYNSNQWAAQVNQWTMQNPPTKAKKNKPKNWQVRNAKWINVWSKGKGRYYRKEFNCKKDGTLVRIMATADEFWDLYLDGEHVMYDQPHEVGYTTFKQYDTVLSKGIHTFAAYSRSFPWSPGDGVDNFLFAMCELDTNGHLIKPALLVSDGSWIGHKGDPPPGWNKAEVLRAVVQEAQARKVESAQRLTLGFDKDNDSKGRRWPRQNFNQEVQIGTTCLDLQGTLSEGNGFDVWVDPADLTIKAYNRRGRDKSASVTLEPGRNLLDWTVEENDNALNDFLIQYNGGWTEYKAKGSAKNYGTRESFISLGGVKDDQSARHLMKRAAEGIASAQNRAGSGEVTKRPADQPDGGLIGVVGAFPFLDFNVGDTVKGPNRNGRLVGVRVLALSGSEDDNGFLSFDPDLEEV